MENWTMIKQDGILKSWKKLKAEGVINEEQPVGRILVSHVADHIR